MEQNMLFREGLRSLGYKITSLQGRVVRGMAIDAPRFKLTPLGRSVFDALIKPPVDEQDG